MIHAILIDFHYRPGQALFTLVSFAAAFFSTVINAKQFFSLDPFPLLPLSLYASLFCHSADPTQLLVNRIISRVQQKFFSLSLYGALMHSTCELLIQQK